MKNQLTTRVCKMTLSISENGRPHPIWQHRMFNRQCPSLWTSGNSSERDSSNIKCHLWLVVPNSFLMNRRSTPRSSYLSNLKINLTMKVSSWTKLLLTTASMSLVLHYSTSQWNPHRTLLFHFSGLESKILMRPCTMNHKLQWYLTAMTLSYKLSMINRGKQRSHLTLTLEKNRRWVSTPKVTSHRISSGYSTLNREVMKNSSRHSIKRSLSNKERSSRSICMRRPNNYHLRYMIISLNSLKSNSNTTPSWLRLSTLTRQISFFNTLTSNSSFKTTSMSEWYKKDKTWWDKVLQESTKSRLMGTNSNKLR